MSPLIVVVIILEVLYSSCKVRDSEESTGKIDLKCLPIIIISKLN